MVTLFGARRPLLASLVVLVLDVSILFVGLRFPPYPTPSTNHLRAGLDASLVWVQLVSVIAASLRPGGVDPSNPLPHAISTFLGFLPLGALLVFFATLYFAHSGKLDCIRETEKRVNLYVDDGSDLFTSSRNKNDSGGLQQRLSNGSRGKLSRKRKSGLQLLNSDTPVNHVVHRH